MKLKDTVDIDTVKKFGFHLVERNQETGFKRFVKQYGIFLVTICNKQFEKAIHITLNVNGKTKMENQRMIASIHQLNKDLCLMSERGMLELTKQEEGLEGSVGKALDTNDWDAQMKANNPFAFMID